jgi:acyl-CoA thioesterase YciA
MAGNMRGRKACALSWPKRDCGDGKGCGLVQYANGEPLGGLTLRTLAMPADANAAGDIFGGWVMAQMDLACGIRAAERARGRVVTAAVKEMAFAKPMKIGDTLCVYTHIERVGRTSMTLKVEAWAQRYLSDLMEKVTDADFVMVALDRDGKPKQVPAEA